VRRDAMVLQILRKEDVRNKKGAERLNTAP
jgi:hypothetical protein